MMRDIRLMYHEALIVFMFLVISFFMLSFVISADEPPVVFIIAPANSSNYSFGNIVSFEWNVTDEESTVNCDLIIDEVTVRDDISSETGGILNSVTEQPSVGIHNWYISCSDTALNVGNSQTRTITITNQLPYNGTALVINSTLGLNRTLEDLNVRTTLLDQNGQKMNVTVRWYNQSVLHLVQMYNSSYSNGSTFIATLGHRNTTKGHNWSAQLTIHDSYNSSSFNSSSLTILNSPPNVTLNAPLNNTVSVNGSNQEFSWFQSDDDLDTIDSIEFNLTLRSGSSCSDSNYNGASPLVNEPSSPLNLFTAVSCNDTYLWSIRASDASTGNYATYRSITFTGNLAPNLTLNSPSNSSEFGLEDIISFNWTVIDDLSQNMICNLTIGSLVNQSNIVSPNNTMVNRSISGFDEGNYLWNVSCLDSLGLRTNSVTRAFEVVDFGDSPTFGGGGESQPEGNRKEEQVVEEYWEQVYDKTSEDLSSDGVLQEFKEKEAIKIKVEEEDYTLGVSSINSEKASFSIDSILEDYIFYIGETRRFDLDNDGQEEIVVTLVGIDSGVAVFDIKQIIYSSETEAEFYEDIAKRKFRLVIDDKAILVYVILLVVLITLIIMNKIKINKARLKRDIAGFKN